MGTFEDRERGLPGFKYENGIFHDIAASIDSSGNIVISVGEGGTKTICCYVMKPDIAEFISKVQKLAGIGGVDEFSDYIEELLVTALKEGWSVTELVRNLKEGGGSND